MPDIQTEIQKILHIWELPKQIEITQQPEDTPMFTSTNNTSRATFEIVRDQPYKTKGEYIKLLDQKGFKKSSTSSLLAQMIRQKHISVDDMGLLHVNQPEYRPLKAASTVKNQAKKTSKLRTPTTYKTKEVPVPEGIAALVEEHKGRKERDEVKHIMDTINLPDAKRLYKALAEYFGSV